MSGMEYKSKENFFAANLLMENEMYTASIHCLYYSCFQFSKYVLKKFGLDYGSQEKESKGKDTHFYIINNTSKKIDTKSHIDFLDFEKNMSNLKRLRKKSDYSVDVITKTEAEKGRQNAMEVEKILIRSIK
jgi:hypothetical protein